jgi:hypothetical protein
MKKIFWDNPYQHTLENSMMHKKIVILISFMLLSSLSYGMETSPRTGSEQQLELKDLYFGEDPKRFGPLVLPEKLTDDDQQEANDLVEAMENSSYCLSHDTYPVQRNAIAKAIICGKYHNRFVDVARTYQDYYAWQHLINNRAKIKEIYRINPLYQNLKLDKWEPVMPYLKSPMIIELFYKADQESIKQKDSHGMTIVHHACARYNYSTPAFLAYCLLRYPQAVYIEDRTGLTPLNVLCTGMLAPDEKEVAIMHEKLTLLKNAKANFWHRYCKWPNSLDWLREAIDFLKKHNDPKLNMNIASTFVTKLETIMNEQHEAREAKITEAKNQDCSICLEPMSSGFLRILCCEHVFHVGCAFTRTDCPICRAKIYNG